MKDFDSLLSQLVYSCPYFPSFGDYKILILAKICIIVVIMESNKFKCSPKYAKLDIFAL